jgi:hypothetical protein
MSASVPYAAPAQPPVNVNLNLEKLVQQHLGAAAAGVKPGDLGVRRQVIMEEGLQAVLVVVVLCGRFGSNCPRLWVYPFGTF